MIFDFFRKPKIGSIKLGAASIRESEEFDVPAQPGHLKGVIVQPSERGETCFYSYDEQKLYVTFREYGEWQGMVCEGPIEADDSILDDELNGYAYQLFVRCNGDGKLYELPSPDVIRGFPKSKECRCPFCMIEHAEGIKIGGDS